MSEKKQPSSKKKPEAGITASKVKKALKIQGFPLEVEVYKLFLDNDWDAELEASFRTLTQNPGQEAREWMKMLARRSDEPPMRFIDVTAEKWVRGKKIGVTIECKSHQTIPWVFYEEEKMQFMEDYSIGERSSISKLSRTASNFESKRKEIRKCSHHTALKHPKIARAGHVVPLARGAQDARDSLYEACSTVIDALEYNFGLNASTMERVLRRETRNENDVMNHYWRWYPVVVFGGSMFSINVKKKGDFNVKPANYIQYSFKTGAREYLVDIVQRRFLKSYIKILETELDCIDSIQL
ncbi:MAG: hypothetical protein ACFFFC_04010 [Candidatus Thorarchaeota archaeon]